MLILALLMRMFPQRINRKQINPPNRTLCEEEPLNENQLSKETEIKNELPKLKEFPKALAELLKNKVLIFNIMSTIFSVLGASGYTMFLSKYIEVQFNKSRKEATILTGPVTIAGNYWLQHTAVLSQCTVSHFCLCFHRASSIFCISLTYLTFPMKSKRSLKLSEAQSQCDILVSRQQNICLI